MSTSKDDVSTSMMNQNDIYVIDPFASVLLTWRDETKSIQPLLPPPEYNLRKQPSSDNKVKQNRENKKYKY